MNDRRHFEQGGADYAAHRPTYPPELAEWLAGACSARSHALDVGCGTGQLTLLLADHFDRVTAIDPSEAQIANAKPHCQVEYCVGTAEKIALPNASIDLLAAAQAAHWFDLDGFYAEARRVARRGALLALISYGIPRLEGAIGEVFDAFYWGDLHEFWPEGRAHVEAGYAELSFPFAECALPPLAIRRSWDFAALEGYIRTWSAAKRARAASQEALLATGLRDIAAAWGDPARRRDVTWPIAGRLARLD